MLSNHSTFAETSLGTMSDNTKTIQKDTSFRKNEGRSEILPVYHSAQQCHEWITSDTETVYVKTWWQNTILGVEIGLGILTTVFGILYVLQLWKKKKEQA